MGDDLGDIGRRAPRRYLALRYALLCDRLVLVSAATRDLPVALEAAARIRMMRLVVGNPATIEWVRQKPLPMRMGASGAARPPPAETASISLMGAS